MSREGGNEASAELLTFLIADIRGYTSYTQVNGDEAAARLAAAFAEIVREGVEARDGRVIELRGDEALAVFSSARQALRAAVDVQAALVDEVERHPSMPLRAGMGLDAGEAIPVEDGYRGGALNLAARLCSQAGPGEVLASTGVRHLARAVDGLRFEERGVLELKGMAEPVPVLRVLGDGSDRFAERLAEAAGGVDPPDRAAVPRTLSTTGTLVPDRESQARRLRWAWRWARRGTGSVIVIQGEEGMGKTRMAAEAATVAARDGASIVHIESGGEADLLLGLSEPALVVVDPMDPADRVMAAAVEGLVAGISARSVLLVATTPDPASLPPGLAGVDRIVLEPISIDGVAEIVALEAGEIAERAPLAAILEASAGVPARVHELVARWVRDESERRLREAAARAALRRSDLRALEAEVATSVIDLQLARERAELFGPAGEATIDGTVESPYKGLATFESDDVDVFFGRERLVADMVGRLVGSPFLGVVGPSGSGKSSAVRAGLLPALAAGALPASHGWIRAVTRPGRYPLRALDRAVWAALPEGLRADMESVELPLRALRDRLQVDECLVLIVDQFEELFTQTDDEDERAAFVRALVEAVDDPRGNVIVVAAIRADFYGRCAVYPRLAEIVGASHVLVGPMTADEFRRAIEGPARRAGLAVDPDLTDALVREVVDEPGGLPLLSAALLELWQHRHDRTIPMEAYAATGGVRGAVGRLAEAAFATLGEEAQQVARAVMLRLAGPGEGDAIVRRRVPLAEFDVDRNDDVAAVLAAFTASRLLTVGEGTVEVAHEALLREWPRLGAWLEDDRAGIRLRGHMQVAAADWAEGGRDPGELYRGARLASAMDWTADHSLELNDLEREFLQASRSASELETERQRRANRRLRGLLVGVAAFLVLALVAGGLAVVQRNKAETAETEATASRLGGQGVIESDLDTALLLAAQAYEIDASNDTRSTLLATLLRAPAAIAVLPGTGSRVNSLDGAGDGSVFVTVDNIGGMAIYDAVTIDLLRTVDAPTLGGYDVGHDGSFVLGEDFGDDGVGYQRITTEAGEPQVDILPEGVDLGGAGVALDPDDASFVAIEFHEGREFLVRRSADDYEELQAVPFDVGPVGRLQMFPDGHRVVGESDGSFVVIDAETLRVERSIADGSFAFGVSPDGRTVGFGRQDGTVAFVDVVTGEMRDADGRHNAGVIAAGFSPDGGMLLTSSDDGTMIVWDVATGAKIEVLSGHAGKVFGPVFDADGSTAFSAGLDGQVIAWDLTSERRIGRRFSFAAAADLCCADVFAAEPLTVASSDGTLLASATTDGNVRVDDGGTGAPIWEEDPWDEARSRELRDLEPIVPQFLTPYVLGLAFDDDRSLLAVAGGTREVVVYDAASGSEVRRYLATEQGWVNGVAFAPDGSLVTANDDGRVVVWDLAVDPPAPVGEYRLFEEATTPDDYQGPVLVGEVSPDGTLLGALTVAIGTGESQIVVFDTTSGERLWERLADPFGGTIEFSSDSTILAYGGRQSGKLGFRDARTGEAIGSPVLASAGFVLDVDESPELGLWVTTGTDGTTRLFDGATHRQVGSNIDTGEANWTRATVLRDGLSMLVSSEGGHAWRWDLDPARWSEQACSVAGRILTEEEWSTFLPDRPYEPACG